MTKKVDFEAHFVTENYIRALKKNTGYPRMDNEGPNGLRRMVFAADAFEPFGDVLFDRLMDLGAGRIAVMDQTKVDVQVLTLTAPGLEQLDPDLAEDLARDTNNELAAAITNYPDRYQGFAALGAKKPDTAALELERAVKTLGLKGWKTHSNYGDEYLDHPRFRPILEAAAALNAPIYLHPTLPAIPQLREYGFPIAGAPFGFGVETAMCLLRLIYSGALDQFPNLTIILGHLGETLPFILQRIDFPFLRAHFDDSTRPKIKKRPSEYIKEQVLVTTSGMPFKPAFECTRAALGMDHIMLGTDYPYENPAEAMAFLEALPYPDKEMDMVWGGNATRIGFAV
jgi:predicted TIM-barrel fold metal-dependent hydrolase